MDITATEAYCTVALFGVSLILDVLLAGLGVGWYYRFGIPVFHRTFAVTRFPDLPPKALSEAYENEFQTPLAFVSISLDEIGFHEWGSLLSYRSRWGRTFPVLHGLVRFDRLAGQVRVTCYFNWFFLAMLGMAFWLLKDDWLKESWRFFIDWEGIVFWLLFFIFFFWFPYLNFSSVCWFLKDRKY